MPNDTKSNPTLEKTCLWLVLLALFSVPVQAQDGQAFADNKSRLSIQQAVAVAVENNLELNTYRERTGIARGQLTGAAVFPTNPGIDFSYFNINSLGETGRSAEYSFILSQEFEIGGQRGYRKQVARSNIDMEEARAGRIQRLVVSDVRENFYRVLLQQEKLALADRVIALTEDLVRRTEEKFSAGYAPEFEVNFARLELQNALREKARVTNQLRVAEYSLNNLMGRPGETEFIAAGELIHQPLAVELEGLKAYALSQRRDLRALRFEESAAASQVSLARSVRRPNLRFSLGYSRAFDSNLFGPSISVPINLFNRNQGGIATTLATQRTAGAEYAFLELLVEKEVIAAHSDALLASEEVRLLEDATLELVQDNLDLVQQAYLSGEEVEIIEVIAAQRGFVEIQTAYLEALYSFNAAVVNLETVLGGEVGS